MPTSACSGRAFAADTTATAEATLPDYWLGVEGLAHTHIHIRYQLLFILTGDLHGLRPDAAGPHLLLVSGYWTKLLVVLVRKDSKQH